MIDVFLGTRCIDKTRPVPKKSFIIELHTTFLSKKSTKFLHFVIELRKKIFSVSSRTVRLFVNEFLLKLCHTLNDVLSTIYRYQRKANSLTLTSISSKNRIVKFCGIRRKQRCVVSRRMSSWYWSIIETKFVKSVRNKFLISCWI